MSYTGTQASPLSGLVCQEFVKNESPKNKLYRWRCTSYTSGTLATYMDQQSQEQVFRGWFKIPGSDGLYIGWDNDEPASGADGDGAGFAGHGSLYIDTSADGRVYFNQTTKDMVSWTTL